MYSPRLTPIIFLAQLATLFLLQHLFGVDADFSWPHGRIPYLDDHNLLVDPDQAVALNNARMDLQVRTCIKFVPRRAERDYAFFSDLGPQVECWNLFEKSRGRVMVNAGPSCLEPMRRPHVRELDVPKTAPILVTVYGRDFQRPKRVFSDCDIEYVNHVFNCPRRRKTSPICPPGQSILARPLLTSTAPPHASTVTPPTTTIRTRGGKTTTRRVTAGDGDGSHETTMTAPTEGNFSGEGGDAETDAGGDRSDKKGDGDEGSHATGFEGGDGEVAGRIGSGEEAHGTDEDDDHHIITHSGEAIPKDKNTSAPTTTTKATATTTTAASTTVTTTTATTTESTSTTTTPPPTTTPTTTELTTTTTTTQPSSTVPLMMTLISTTTTIRPPKPEWVKSIEGQALDGENGPHTMAGDSSARKRKLGPSEMHSSSSETGRGGGLAVEVDMGDPLPNEPKRKKVGGRDGVVGEPAGTDTDEERGGGFITSISKTKVTTTIEKSKYVGPCGSACSYSGGLAKLYRSYNDKIEVNNHFYTTDRLEHHLMAAQGYVVQPHMGHLGKSQVDPQCLCLKPLYRLYNDFMKDHLLTSTEQEKDIAERILGYKFEHVLGYCAKEPGCGAYLPLFRFYNPIAKDHLYTVDQQEMHYYKNHPEQAYGFEYIECYVWANNSSAKACPAISLIGGIGSGNMPETGTHTPDRDGDAPAASLNGEQRPAVEQRSPPITIDYIFGDFARLA